MQTTAPSLVQGVQSLLPEEGVEEATGAAEAAAEVAAGAVAVAAGAEEAPGAKKPGTETTAEEAAE